AERIFFILEYLGVRDVKVLAGGFAGWQKSGGPVTREQTAVEPGNFTADPQDHLIAGAARIESIIQNHNGHIIDARPFEEYSGQSGSTDRKGHIAGAANLVSDNLFEGIGAPKSAHQMRLAFDGVAV